MSGPRPAVEFWAGTLCAVAGIWILGTYDSTWWVNTYFPAALTMFAGFLLVFSIIEERRSRRK